MANGSSDPQVTTTRASSARSDLFDARLERTDLEPWLGEHARSRVLIRTPSAHVPSHQPRSLPTRSMGLAMVSWLTMIFGLCYLALPVGLALTGLNVGLVAAAPFALPAFGMASLVAIVATLLARPNVRLDVFGARDPVLSATVGGLGVWALIHNSSSLLVPFHEMAALEFGSFLALNVLEMSLLGMMFASFTRRRSVAMALGGGFQLLMLGLCLTLMAL